MRISGANPWPHPSAKRGQVPVKLTGEHSGPAIAPPPIPERARRAPRPTFTPALTFTRARELLAQQAARIRQGPQGPAPTRAQQAARDNLGSVRGG